MKRIFPLTDMKSSISGIYAPPFILPQNCSRHFPILSSLMEITLPFPFTIILAFYILSLSSSSSAFSPSTSYFLTCGSSTSISHPDDNSSRVFHPDTTYLTSNSAGTKTLTNPSATGSSLYSHARLFTSPASYKFTPISPGTYIVRLHFFPFSAQSLHLSTSNFSVSALDHFTLLTHFSVPATTTAPVIKEFLLYADSDPLTLDLVPYSLAFVNAIEVFNAPPNLIDDGETATYVTAAGNGTPLGQLSNEGLETLYRVNVGGSLVTPANDTLWRTWVSDDPYIFQSSVSFKNSTSASAIVYSSSDPRQTPEIAPQSVYDTARTMAIREDMRNYFNVTWSFNVTPGETHFIRMHFCDFVSTQVNALYFNVYIGNLLAFPDLQPSSFTDQTPAAAFYLDFAADSDESGLMNVSIGRSNKINTPQTANALLNGLEIMKLGLDSTTTNKHKNGAQIKILIPSIVFGVILVSILILAAVFLHKRRRQAKSAVLPKASPPASWSPFAPNSAGTSTSEFNFNSTSPRINLDLQIPFEEIKFATDNFSDNLVIGTGGFGKVYKGVLRDGTKIAVKRGMPESKQGYPEFQTEIEVLSRIRHRHLVSLIGYCNDHSEMILVYEYMEKGPLKNYLYGSNNLPSLTWKQRLEICIGAARGLHYLHTGYSHNIIHRDIKSTNILLGDDYLAKVADFGLSRVGPSFGETHVSTGVKGTFGYLDPEYYKIQKLTDKSDVYSFGVMMFEVLCARPVIDPKLSREQLNLAEWAVLSQRRGRLEKIIDPKLVGEINENSLTKFGQTAEKCLANYGVDRPTIGDVLWNLEYALQLQMTELRREPFEDSGVVEARVEVNVMRRVLSLAVRNEVGDEEGEGTERRLLGGESGVSESMVFSQLITGDGR